VSHKTKAQLEQEVEEYRQQTDAIADVLSDGSLSEIDKLNEIDDVVFDDDDDQ